MMVMNVDNVISLTVNENKSDFFIDSIYLAEFPSNDLLNRINEKETVSNLCIAFLQKYPSLNSMQTSDKFQASIVLSYSSASI